MTDSSPVDVVTTVLMTVDASARVSVYAGGDKLGEYAVNNGVVPAPQAVSSIRFASTDTGTQAGTMLVQAIYGWTSVLSEADAAIVSGNLNYAPPSAAQPPPILSIPTALDVREGQVLQIPIAKSGTGACSVRIRTIANTATLDVDYTGFLQVVNLGANDTVLNVPLGTLADTVADTGERLNVELSLPVDCTLGNALCAVTINEPPRVAIAATLSVNEGSAANITVTKVGWGACSVTWRTMASTATLNSDYTGVNATLLSFGATEVSKTIVVQTLADTANEANETFNVVLENAVDCTISTATCVVTILDPNTGQTPDDSVFQRARGFAGGNFGIGLPIYRVTNLNDTGAGSLRQGAQAGNCTIIFEVGGRIVLASNIALGSNLTIAGETAPAPGITVQKFEFGVRSANLEVRHITFQRGYDPTNRDNCDVGKVAPGSGTVPSTGKIVTTNIKFSHCAFYWGLDETIEHWPWNSRSLTNVSYHDCIFAEPLWLPKTYNPNFLNHVKVENGTQSQHNYGVLLGWGTKSVDMQYCLFADMDMREPFIDHSTEVVLANMIANNCCKGATIQQNQTPVPATYQATCKGYLCISGPNTGTTAYGGFRFQSYRNPQPANSRVYVSNLYGWKGGAANSTYQTPANTVTYQDQTNGAYWMNGTTRVAVRVSTPPIDTPVATVPLTDQQIYDRALFNLGPRPKEIRDAAVAGNKDVRRTVDRLRNKTGRWTNHENEVGGFYAPTQTTRRLDGTTSFPDGTAIPAAPALPQPATATSRAAMTAWLERFLRQIQYD